ncbi:MAG TPA: aminotransferase class V-fold PLP-dependent enzyme [Xanthobacteraceae bacterium]|jgi:alanine-glyoxylate transaminase / serine-glyoxylate transaminase / serine-pyruvate transaminase
MAKNTSRVAGRHFLHIPGPTPLPDRVLRAMDNAIIDHRGPEFAKLTKRVLEGIKTIFKTTKPVIIYTATGTGAWEAALVNTLSPGDRVLMVETGQFAALWKNMATKLGLKPEFIETDWRIGADPNAIEAHLKKDKAHEIKAVCILHNETSTGCLSPIAEIRKAIDAAGHPALFIVDTISSLASTDYRHDEWGVDVTVGGAQKGLMLPPGMSFNAVSDKALATSKTSKFSKSFWAWEDMLNMNKQGFFPYTPATNMLYGLREAIDMLHEEGLDNVFARHDRFAEATRRAVRAWGLEILCRDPKYYSPTITAVLLPDGHDADAFRALALEQFNISYGMSFGKYAGKMFRIGHLGDINDLTLLGALAGTEMALSLAGVPHKKGGVQAAMDYLTQAARGPARAAAE